jgi:methylmalonyl-CoA mutase N-terminal domain/subunit
MTDRDRDEQMRQARQRWEAALARAAAGEGEAPRAGQHDPDLTIGEICGTLREVFGEYRAAPVY